MLKISIETAKQIANTFNVPVEIVWKIIKNMKTKDMKTVIDAVMKALRL